MAAPAAAAEASAAAAPGSAPAAAAAQSSYGDVSLGKPTSDVGVLRRRLLEKIVDKRLFRESELRPFLVAVSLGNKHLDAAIGDAVESEAQVLAHRQSLVERRGCEGDGAGIAPSVGIEAERIKLLACARAQSGGDGDHARVCTLHTRE